MDSPVQPGIVESGQTGSDAVKFPRHFPCNGRLGCSSYIQTHGELEIHRSGQVSLAYSPQGVWRYLPWYRGRMADKTGSKQGKAQPLQVPYPGKAAVPARRGTIVHRERLIEALDQASDRRVTVISAPPGYGKTTLLVDFAQERTNPVCWYSLDERDTDPKTFLTYFLAAGRSQFPDFGAGAEDAIEKDLGGSALTDLLVSATASAGRGFTFILDDFHFLDSASEEFRSAIEGWVYRLPQDVHVILSGRTRPQLSVLPMMTVRQETETIDAADFSFTTDEVAQLYRQALGKEISLDDSQRLADVTEGWAGALILMAEKAQDAASPTLEQLRASDTLFQYISLEQFEPLSAELRDFLRASAILRTLDVSTVNELLGVNDAEEKLGVLARLNLAVSPEDSSEYRYHRLFRAFLVSHMRANDPERFRELNEEAARIAGQAGHWDDAVYHYIQASAWDSIIEITDRVGSRMFEEGKWDTLAEWLDAIPADELARQPKLMLWKARVLHYLNQVDRALALLAQAIQVLETNEDWVTLAEAHVSRGMCLRLKGDYTESRDTLQKARTLLMTHDAPVPLVTEARKELGMTLSRCGDLTDSIQELSAVVDIYEAQGDQYNLAQASVELAAVLGLVGRLGETIVHLERARNVWTELGHDFFLVQTLVNLGMIYYLQGDLDRAESIFQQGLGKAREIGNVTEQIYHITCLADIRKARGDYSTSMEMYRSALEDSWAVSDAYVRVYLLDAIADAYRLMGDIASAEPASQRALAEAEKTGGALELGICLMTNGLIKRSQDDAKGAIEQLEKAIPYLSEKGAGREVITAHFHLAGIYFALKKKKMALEKLQICADMVKDLGYDHFLVAEASRNSLLVQYASANKLADGYYSRLLKMIKGSGKSEDTEDGEKTAEEGAIRTIYAFGFGNLRVEADGREVTDLEWRSEKSKEMFFFFLANRRPLRKEEIVDAIWPEMPDEKTTSAFHSNMYRLRKALYQEVIAKDSGRYILDPQARFTFDVHDYQGALRADTAPKGSPEALKAMERAVELYKGAFASDFYSEWAQTLRYQLEEQQMSLLGSLAAAYNEAGEYKKSADICQRIIEVDEFNEDAWYRLMSNYVQSGQSEAARYCYNRYVQIISEDDMDDDVPEFDELVREISGGKQRM